MKITGAAGGTGLQVSGRGLLSFRQREPPPGLTSTAGTERWGIPPVGSASGCSMVETPHGKGHRGHGKEHEVKI